MALSQTYKIEQPQPSFMQWLSLYIYYVQKWMSEVGMVVLKKKYTNKARRLNKVHVTSLLLFKYSVVVIYLKAVGM